MNKNLGAGIAGLGAGILNGLFGAGGGMVLVPLLNKYAGLDDSQLFGTSVSILLPVSVVSLLLATGWDVFSLKDALPYLLGSAAGGVLASLLGKKIPSIWLHRTLGILILWGGIRYLW